MNEALTVITSVISSGAISALLTAFLNQRNNKQLERLKSDLSAAHFKVSRNFDKYSEAYINVYASAIKLQLLAAEFISNHENAAQNEQNTMLGKYLDASKDFNTLFRTNGIFFSKPLEIKVAELSNYIDTAITSYKRYYMVVNRQDINPNLVERLEEGFNTISAKVLLVSEELKQEFRKQLELE